VIINLLLTIALIFNLNICARVYTISLLNTRNKRTRRKQQKENKSNI